MTVSHDAETMSGGHHKDVTKFDNSNYKNTDSDVSEVNKMNRVIKIPKSVKFIMYTSFKQLLQMLKMQESRMQIEKEAKQQRKPDNNGENCSTNKPILNPNEEDSIQDYTDEGSLQTTKTMINL